MAQQIQTLEGLSSTTGGCHGLAQVADDAARYRTQRNIAIAVGIGLVAFQAWWWVGKGKSDCQSKCERFASGGGY